MCYLRKINEKKCSFLDVNCVEEEINVVLDVRFIQYKNVQVLLRKCYSYPGKCQQWLFQEQEHMEPISVQLRERAAGVAGAGRGRAKSFA